MLRPRLPQLPALDEAGRPLLELLDRALTATHRYVRTWRAALAGDGDGCWSDLERAAAADCCGGAA